MAFLDELEKIAADLTSSEKRKRWLKNALLISGGAAAAAGAATLASPVTRELLGDTWSRMTPTAKMALVGPALGVAAYGMKKALKKRSDEENRRMRE